MKIFLAGGTGAVGRQLVPQLIAAGHAVVAITRKPDRIAELRIGGTEPIACDIFDRDRLISIVREARPDAIINQLTDLPSTMEPRRLTEIYERNNRVRREGTRNLLEAAGVGSVRRFVAQSMATWYAPVGSRIKSESDPLWLDAPEPIGTAVRTVATMEEEILRAIPIAIILRYGAFYGPGTWYARGQEIAERVRRRAFPLVGQGAGITSFVHVRDAASAAVVASSAAISGVYNVVDDEPAAASEWLPVYARALEAATPRRVPTLLAPMALGRPLTTWLTTMRGASNAKIKRELGWSLRYASWREGFKEL
jgi:nucleoside-diphosphate-sugar epimerase